MGMSATLTSPPYYKPCMQEELHLRSVFTLCCLRLHCHEEAFAF